jgi:hypothetical protein
MGLALERKTFSIFNAVDNRFPILQDQIPRMRTVCGGEECNIVAAATAYIYKQGLVDARIETTNQALGHRVEPFIPPVRLSGAIGRHEGHELI